jgi:hypothetical protein
MQKLADGHDTDVTSSPPWLWSRCVAGPHAGAAPDCEVAGWPPAGELAPGSGGADDDPLHPVAAPISRIDTQASARRSLFIRLVSTVRPSRFRHRAGQRARVPAAVTLAVTILTRVLPKQPGACQPRARTRRKPETPSCSQTMINPAHQEDSRLTPCVKRPSRQRVAGWNPARHLANLLAYGLPPIRLINVA